MVTERGYLQQFQHRSSSWLHKENCNERKFLASTESRKNSPVLRLFPNIELALCVKGIWIVPISTAGFQLNHAVEVRG